MPFAILGKLAVKIAFMVGLGFILRSKNLITRELKNGLSDLLLRVILPLSILTSANSPFSAETAGRLAQSALIAAGYYAAALLLLYLLGRRLPLSRGGRPIFMTMAVFANVGFIGFPLVKELYGEEGTLYAVIYNLAYQLFLFTIGTSLLKKGGPREEQGNCAEREIDWGELVRDPMTIASVLAIFIFISPFRFPPVIEAAINSVGDMTVPVSMLIIGCDLAGVHAAELFRDKYSYLVSGLRLLALPLLLLAVLRLAHADPFLTAVMVLMTALPCGSLNVILAQKYQCEPEFAARTVIQSMLLMLVTIPLVLFVLA